MRCHAFFARCCAALPIAVVLVLAAVSQLPGDEGSRVVVLTKGMTSLELTDEEATFGPRIPPGGVAGTLRLAVPIEGCERLKNKYDGPWIALLKRGGTDPSCSFVTKVRYAQYAGAIAAIVYDDRDAALTPMAKSPAEADPGVPSVFVSAASGRTLARAVAELGPEMVVRITPGALDGQDPVSLAASAFVACVAAAAVLSLFWLMQRFDPRARAAADAAALAGVLPSTPRDRVASLEEVEARSRTRTHVVLSPGDDEAAEAATRNGTNDVCTVCLEEYDEGDEIRELECEHAFHKTCIDEWLTTKRACCPCCKHSLVPAAPPSAGAPESEVPAPPRRRRRRRYRRGRGAGTGAEGAARGDGDEVAGADVEADVEAAGRTFPDEEEDRGSATVPLLASRADHREDGSSSNAGGVFGWVARLVSRNRAETEDDDENENENENENDDAAEPPYVAPRAVDVETGGE